MTEQLDEKLARLYEVLQGYESMALGFSGGVDSTFLAAACARAIPHAAVLMHLINPFAGTPEVQAVRELTEHNEPTSSDKTVMGLPLIEIPFDPFDEDKIVRNAPDRCYQCKRAGFSRIVEAAQARGISVVFDGSNADDSYDDRPGMRALRELGVLSPLMETGWHKAEEREMLRRWGVPIWNMPAGACLATRIATGEALSAEKLDAVRACEDYLHGCGLKQVRARLSGDTVRIEAAPDDLDRLATMATTDEDAGGRELRMDARKEPDDGVCIPPSIVHELQRLSRRTVNPVARTYRYGGSSPVGMP
ncbi:ATP-dependent sacrificial sulfur transferase LarE [Collinsella sp. An2]|uniref:ATP-dependent sacrificial sulfur transferase LarE n=1 Tax=Collinsella sp. An2 TaxID=1965585 RepID=UPI000B366B8F|nr:ATP-dependent sacrificial sulfur transferase LarE [Collinsella sp. An2]OUP10494.1 hypothetical protein B5F33_02700 [Collinsella sp. An2]